jgi:hypothetical protein
MVTDYEAYLSHLNSLPEPRPAVTKLQLHNSTEALMEVRLEPWGDVIRLAPGGYYDVLAHGWRDDLAINDGLTIAVEKGGQVIALWAEGQMVSLRIYQEGALVWERDGLFHFPAHWWDSPVYDGPSS